MSHREAVMALRRAHFSVFTSKGEFAQPGYATKDFSLMDTRSREESDCPPPLHIHTILQTFSRLMVFIALSIRTFYLLW